MRRLRRFKRVVQHHVGGWLFVVRELLAYLLAGLWWDAAPTAHALPPPPPPQAASLSHLRAGPYGRGTDGGYAGAAAAAPRGAAGAEACASSGGGGYAETAFAAAGGPIYEEGPAGLSAADWRAAAGHGAVLYGAPLGAAASLCAQPSLPPLLAPPAGAAPSPSRPLFKWLLRALVVVEAYGWLKSLWEAERPLILTILVSAAALAVAVALPFALLPLGHLTAQLEADGAAEDGESGYEGTDEFEDEIFEDWSEDLEGDGEGSITGGQGLATGEDGPTAALAAAVAAGSGGGAGKGLSQLRVNGGADGAPALGSSAAAAALGTGSEPATPRLPGTPRTPRTPGGGRGRGGAANGGAGAGPRGFARRGSRSARRGGRGSWRHVAARTLLACSAWLAEALTAADRWLRRHCDAALDAAVSALLVVAVIVGSAALSLVMVVQIGEESRAALVGVHSLVQNKGRAANLTGVWRTLEGYERQLEAALPSLADRAEEQLTSYLAARNLTGLARGLEALRLVLKLPGSCTDEARERIAVAAARAELAASEARAARDVLAAEAGAARAAVAGLVGEWERRWLPPLELSAAAAAASGAVLAVEPRGWPAEAGAGLRVGPPPPQAPAGRRDGVAQLVASPDPEQQSEGVGTDALDASDQAVAEASSDGLEAAGEEAGSGAETAHPTTSSNSGGDAAAAAEALEPPPPFPPAWAAAGGASPPPPGAAAAARQRRQREGQQWGAEDEGARPRQRQRGWQQDDPQQQRQPVEGLAESLVEATGRLEGLQRRLADAQSALDAALEQLTVSEAKTRACQQQAASAAAAAALQGGGRSGVGGGGAGAAGWAFAGMPRGGAAGSPSAAGLNASSTAAGPVLQIAAALRGLSVTRVTRQVAAFYSRAAASRPFASFALSSPSPPSAAAGAGASDAGSSADGAASSGVGGGAPGSGSAGAAAPPPTAGPGGAAGNATTSLTSALHAAAYPLLRVASSVGASISGVLVAGVGGGAAVALGTGLGLLRLGLGVAKFLVQVAVFASVLYALLALDIDPIDRLVRLLPVSAENQERASKAVTRALRGVFVSSLKLAIFHSGFTWVTFRLFGVSHFVHLATALSAVVAVLPLLPVAAVALPGVAELFLLRGRPLKALALGALHLGAYTVCDDLIYREVEPTMPYILSLGVYGGLSFKNPLQGVLLGPMLLALLSVAYSLHRDMVA